MSFNPKLGCCEEKKIFIRFLTTKVGEDKPKRIGDLPINIVDVAKVPQGNVSDLKKYNFHKNYFVKLPKAVDRFAMLEYSVDTELIEIDGDDTFSMYHGTECDDTITDASCMENTRPLTDRAYYARPLEHDLKTRIQIDISGDDSKVAKIIGEDKVDRFGNPIEKSVPLDLHDDSPSNESPSKDNDEMEDTKYLLSLKNKQVEEMQEEIQYKDEEVKKLKKKVEEGKSRSEKKEATINKLLKEVEDKNKEIVTLEERIRELESKLSESEHRVEQVEQENRTLKEVGSKVQEKEAVDMVPKDHMLSEINLLHQKFSIERNELKNQLLASESKSQSLKTEISELKISFAELKTEYETYQMTIQEAHKEEMATVISNYEKDNRKFDSKYKREIEILNEKLFAKVNDPNLASKVSTPSSYYRTKE